MKLIKNAKKMIGSNYRTNENEDSNLGREMRKITAIHIALK